MIKILHLGKFYPPDYGGIESVTKSIIDDTTKEIGHKIICFSKKRKRYINDNKNITRCNVLFNIKNQPISLKYFFKSIFEFRKADIIHVHCPNILAYAALLFCFGKKIIIHWHSDILKKGILYKVIQPLEHYILNKSNRIIVTSSEYFDYSKPLKRFSDKVTVIPLGVKDVITRRSSMDNSYRFKKFDNKEIVLSIGRLVKYKGYELLINASKYFSDNIITIIIGTGPERNNILSLIKRNNINNVYLIENINDTQKNELYRRSKIFCLSSLNRQEAFGVVLLEALSFGKPLIVNKISGSGVNWVNKNEYTGLNFNMDDSKKFAYIVNDLMKDTLQLNEYSKNSRDRYNDLFTDKLMNAKIKDLYYQILEKS